MNSFLHGVSYGSLVICPLFLVAMTLKRLRWKSWCWRGIQARRRLMVTRWSTLQPSRTVRSQDVSTAKPKKMWMSGMPFERLLIWTKPTHRCLTRLETISSLFNPLSAALFPFSNFISFQVPSPCFSQVSVEFAEVFSSGHEADLKLLYPLLIFQILHFYQWRCWHLKIVFSSNKVQINSEILSHCPNLNQKKSVGTAALKKNKKKTSPQGALLLFGITLGQSWLTDPHLFPGGQKSHFCHYWD